MFNQNNYGIDNVVSLNVSNFHDAHKLGHALALSETFYTQVWADANPSLTGTEALPAHLRMVHAIACTKFTGAGLPAHVHTLTVEGSDTFTGEEIPDHLTVWEKLLGKRRGLRRLRVHDCPNFSGKNLPLSLEELHIQGFTGTTLKVHRRVRIVSMRNSPHLREVLQDGQPFGLKSKGPFGLTVEGCPNFEGTRLPPHLMRLEVYSSDRFTGEHVPGSVDRLTVVDCPNFEGKYLKQRDHYDRLMIA